MKMKSRLASLLVILATSGPLLSATEVERLRSLCAEQEMQIKQLELKIARLTDTPPPSHTSQPSGTAAPSSKQAAEQSTTYTVKSGDSIERIARRQGTSVAALNKANGLKNDSIIHPGQKLKLPGSSPALAASAPEPTATAKKHTVVSGDTFYGIARKYKIPVDELIAANPGVNHRSLRVGQTINIAAAPQELVKHSDTTATASLASAPSLPIVNDPAPVVEPRASNKPIKINAEITYGQFATNHNTTTKRLDELNGLELDPTTILAQGSELYIPAQP